ncbi:MAG: NUDIX domain-containing protein [Salinivirgaceae bacterium]|nr:NUDIX domain-containing protein [Salinivirgaceae bacterium]
MKNRKLKKEEWLPVVDSEGKIIGKATRTECHKNKELLHPVVHLHVFNSKGELYLQKRPLSKFIQPGKWDTAVGGHVELNETIETSLAREAKEEIDIANFKPQLLFKYTWQSEVESELVFCFATNYSETITPHATELDGGEFWSLMNVKKQLGKGILTPNFEHEFAMLEKIIKKGK